MIIAKYKFNPSTYSNLLPEFNSAFTNYTTSDVNNGDGTITRTIESNSLPTRIKFGYREDTTNTKIEASSLLELIELNTDNVNTTRDMFRYCTNLVSVNTSNWNFSGVTDTRSMFGYCSKLISLDISNWDTSKVTNMSATFDNCTSLTSLDLSNWNTSKVTDMSYMFNKCSSLTSLNTSNWDTSKVTDMNSMFNSCTSLTSLDLSNWDTSNVIDMSYMFNGCSSLTSLDLSNWDTSKVTNMNSMFQNCPSLRKVNLKYANESTISKIHENLPNRANTTKGYILSPISLTLSKNWEILKTNYNEFYLPQPLRKVGDVKDRFYWDEDKGHYCIEQHFTKVVFDGSDDEDWRDKYLNNNDDNSRHCYWALNILVYPPYALTSDVILCDKLTWRNPHNWGTSGVPIEDEFTINDNKFHIFKSSISTVDEFKVWLSQNPVTLIHPLETPIIIDLPHLNQKLTFDSYVPSSSIDIPNISLKPSKVYLDAPIARYRCKGLQPSTQYNVQFDCKGDSGIKVNLGGTEVTFTPTSNWARKNLTITTPSELVNDKLSISNVGITSNNKVDNVMLFSEVIAQEPDYIDGIQSIGEFIESDTVKYKIEIETYDSRWDSI